MSRPGSFEMTSRYGNQRRDSGSDVGKFGMPRSSNNFPLSGAATNSRRSLIPISQQRAMGGMKSRQATTSTSRDGRSKSRLSSPDDRGSRPLTPSCSRGDVAFEGHTRRYESARKTDEKRSKSCLKYNRSTEGVVKSTSFGTLRARATVGDAEDTELEPEEITTEEPPTQPSLYLPTLYVTLLVAMTIQYLISPLNFSSNLPCLKSFYIVAILTVWNVIVSTFVNVIASAVLTTILVLHIAFFFPYYIDFIVFNVAPMSIVTFLFELILVGVCGTYGIAKQDVNIWNITLYVRGCKMELGDIAPWIKKHSLTYILILSECWLLKSFKVNRLYLNSVQYNSTTTYPACLLFLYAIWNIIFFELVTKKKQEETTEEVEPETDPTPNVTMYQWILMPKLVAEPFLMAGILHYLLVCKTPISYNPVCYSSPVILFVAFVMKTAVLNGKLTRLYKLIAEVLYGLALFLPNFELLTWHPTLCLGLYFVFVTIRRTYNDHETPVVAEAETED